MFQLLKYHHDLRRQHSFQMQRCMDNAMQLMLPQQKPLGDPAACLVQHAAGDKTRRCSSGVLLRVRQSCGGRHGAVVGQQHLRHKGRVAGRCEPRPQLRVPAHTRGQLSYLYWIA